MKRLEALESVDKAYDVPERYIDSQPAVDRWMRLLHVNWMMAVCQDFALTGETLHAAVNLVDRYIARSPGGAVTNKNLRVVGIACLFIVLKIRDGVYVPLAALCASGPRVL